jgi:hypothetical protein
VPRKPSGSCSFEIAAKANGSMPWNPVTSAPLKRSRSELEAQARLVRCYDGRSRVQPRRMPPPCRNKLTPFHAR